MLLSIVAMFLSRSQLALWVCALSAGSGLAVAACTLNPQPLPPDDDKELSASPTGPDRVPTADGGKRPFEDSGPPPPPSDAGPIGDGGFDATDASSDGSDGSDGSAPDGSTDDASAD